MKHPFSYILLIALTAVIGCTGKHTSNTLETPIFPEERKIDNDNFTGIAWLTMLAESDSLNPVYAGNVRFEPGTRTNWHSHPAGQLLIVTSGEGYYQERGQPKRILHKGDAVKCPPDTPHWHGASPTSEFTHIAISSSQNGSTVWMEKVTDEVYYGN
jgi:quercetin dioxygenase-like cupin family protein